MVRIKVFKLSQLIYYVIIIIIAVALIGLIASALLGGGDKGEPVRQTTPVRGTSGITETASPDVSPGTVTVPKAGLSSRSGEVDRLSAAMSAQAIIQTEEPQSGEEPGFFRNLSAWVLGFDPADPVSVLSYHLPVTRGFSEQKPQAQFLSAEADFAENELADTSDVGEHILVEIARIEGPYVPAPRGRILIYHTHTYEAYEQDENDPYKEASSQWRTKERDKSIVGVGDALERHLTALGYEVIHDVTEFEPPKLGTAYERSLEMLDSRMEADEEYAMIIDLHRDAWDKVQEKQMTADVDGSPAARLMMLIGTGEGSEGNTFKIKPNWRENYKLADALTTALNELHPGLCRDIMMKTGRYNQHISEHSILIEVGNNKNTLAEAMQAMPALATAIDQVLSGS